MVYVYKQFPRPSNATGLQINLSVVDANGNYRDIGTATSDADGFYSFSWQPDIDGKYTVYASFAGSNSYWPSHAVSAFVADPPAETPQPTQQSSGSSAADLYLLPGIIAIIAVIIIVGIVLLLAVRKRP